MNLNFKNKKILITGGSEGIGKKIVLDFLNLDGEVFIVDKKKPEFLNRLKKNKSLNFIKCNFLKDNEVNFLLRKLSTIDIDILINNARFKAKNRNKIDNFRDNLKLDLQFHFLLSEKLIKEAIKKKRFFKICNISSISSKLISAQSPSYHFSKSSINSMTKYFAVKYGKRNINVNAILPGFILQQRFTKKFNSKNNIAYKKKILKVLPYPRCGTEEDVSNLVLFLTSRYSNFINGENIILDGGASNQDQFTLLL
jgi:3-oxoacyl-[acyl-carrier protein] reductase